MSTGMKAKNKAKREKVCKKKLEKKTLNRELSLMSEERIPNGNF